MCRFSLEYRMMSAVNVFSFTLFFSWLLLNQFVIADGTGDKTTNNRSDQNQALGSGENVRDIKRTSSSITPEDFYKEHVVTRQPVLIENSYSKTPVIENWKSDANIRKLPQSFTVFVEVRTESDKSKEVSLQRFLQNYTKNNWYFYSQIPSCFRGAFHLPNFILCTPILDNLSQSMLWYSGRDQSLSIKRTSKNTIKCVISGTTEISLINPVKFSEKIPANIEDVDVLQVDYDRFPGLAEVTLERAALSSGDCLFIPAEWYHQTNTYGRTISFDVEFDLDEKSGNKCGDHSPNQTLLEQPLKDHEPIDELESTLHYFMGYVLKNQQLTLENFLDVIKKDRLLLANMTAWTDEYRDISQEIFQLLDLSTDGELNAKDLERMSSENIKSLREHIVDRVADFVDIMEDQVDDIAQQSNKQVGLDKFTQEFIGKYVDELESVLSQSIDQFVKTGVMPDVQAKMEAMSVKDMIGKKKKVEPKGEDVKTDSQRGTKESQNIEPVAEKEDHDEIIAEDSIEVNVDAVDEEEIIAEDEDDVHNANSKDEL